MRRTLLIVSLLAVFGLGSVIASCESASDPTPTEPADQPQPTTEPTATATDEPDTPEPTASKLLRDRE
jgi:hypothetical protein